MEQQVQQRRLRFLVASTESDSHTWNLVFLQLLLEENGHDVLNLGAVVPVDLLMDECLAHRPDVVVISSVNGHGHVDGIKAIKALRAHPELREVRVIIGGKLGTLGAGNEVYAQRLLEAGFDAVFLGDQPIDRFTEFLRSQQQALTLAGTE